MSGQISTAFLFLLLWRGLWRTCKMLIRTHRSFLALQVQVQQALWGDEIKQLRWEPLQDLSKR